MNNILKKSYIGDICDINLSTYSLSENWKFVNYLDTGNITKNKIENIQYIDLNIDKLPSRARRKVKLNNIIYSTVRPNQMHYGILTQDIPENFLVSTGFAVLDVDSTQAEPYFVYYSLIQDDNTTALQAIAEQSTSAYPSIKPSDIKNREILLPPLETQQKIAKVLSAIDDKIELNNSINNNLEQQAQAIFKSWFVDFEPFGGTMPNNWCVGCLSDIATITMGQSPSGSSYNENKMGTLFFQGRAEFGYRYPKDRLYTTEPKRIAKANDILISVRAPVGDINIALKECCIGRGLAAIEPKNRYNSFVLYSVFNLKKQLNIFNGEGTVFGSINKDSLNDIKTLIPSKGIVKNFEKIVSPMDNLIKYNCIQNEQLTQLRDTLLPKLMSGEIDVSEVDISPDKLYEPANESKLSAEPYNSSGSFASASKNLPSEQSSSADKLLFNEDKLC